jgi:uncharacterized protein with GYD domain
MPAEAPDHPGPRLRLIVLVNLGPGAMPDKPDRAWHDQLRQKLDTFTASPAIGGELHDLWWTAGPYDMVLHVEVKDPTAANAFSLTLSRKLKSDAVTLLAIPDDAVGPVFDVLHIHNGP